MSSHVLRAGNGVWRDASASADVWDGRGIRPLLEDSAGVSPCSCQGLITRPRHPAGSLALLSLAGQALRLPAPRRGMPGSAPLGLVDYANVRVMRVRTLAPIAKLFDHGPSV